MARQHHGTTVYVNVNFDKEGAEILEEISKVYISTTDEEGNETTKKISLRMEGEEIFSTYFTETMTNGTLQISIGSATSDSTTLQSYLTEASGVTMLLNAGLMPVQYTVDINEYISTDISGVIINIVIYSLLAVVVLVCIYFVIKYKYQGLLASLSYIVTVAIFLLLIRYINVTITIEGLVAVLVLILANFYLVKLLLNNKSLKETYLKTIDAIIVMVIVALVFTFIKWTPISSIGMLMFWGIISTLIGNLIFRLILKISEGRK